MLFMPRDSADNDEKPFKGVQSRKVFIIIRFKLTDFKGDNFWTAMIGARNDGSPTCPPLTLVIRRRQIGAMHRDQDDPKSLSVAGVGCLSRRAWMTAQERESDKPNGPGIQMAISRLSDLVSIRGPGG